MKSSIIPGEYSSIETADVPVVPKKYSLMKRITQLWSNLGMLTLLLMVLLVTADVVGRYFFKKPIAGSSDIIEIMMIIIVYSSLAYGAAENRHVRIKFLYDRLPTVYKSYLSIFTSALSIFTVLLITWRLTARVLNIIENPPAPTSSYFGWNLVPFIIFAAIGSGLFTLQILSELVQSIKIALGKDPDAKKAFME